MEYDLVALALAFGAVLWWMHRRNRIQVRADRSRMYENVLNLFDNPEITQDEVNFPVLEADYNGWRVKLEPIADHVNVRKVPCLWLLVTVRGRMPHAGTLDFLVRPQNTEFYSPASLLPERIEIPPGWPQHAILQSDDPRGMPPAELLTPHVRLFDDPKMKELLVTPRGVRLVYQLDQATRPNYMVLRQMIFHHFTLQTEFATGLLDAAIAIITDLRTPDIANTPDSGKKTG